MELESYIVALLVAVTNSRLSVIAAGVAARLFARNLLLKIDA